MNKNYVIFKVGERLEKSWVRNRLINIDRVNKLVKMLKNESNIDEIKNIISTIEMEFECSNLNLYSYEW